MEFTVVQATEDSTVEQREPSEAEKLQKESKKQELDRQFSTYQETYEKVKQAVEHATDPMEPLNALMLRAINNVDLGTINEVQTMILGISQDFISNSKNTNDSRVWSPYLEINRKYLEYITQLFRLHLSLCDRQKLDSAKIMILDTSEKIADCVISIDSKNIDILLMFWKEVADMAIGDSREIFNKIIQFYRKSANSAFKLGIEANEYWLDEIFRQLGWLGERLISRVGIEEKPLMRDHHYFNEYDQLFEALLTAGYEFNKTPTSYPLIYFDFVDVIFLQLLSVAKKTGGQRLKENIFSCLYIYSSFAETAILKGNNSRGAALATLRLKESYDKLRSEGLEENAKDAIALLVLIGVIASRHKDKLQRVEFFTSGRIDQEVLDVLVSSPFQDKIKHALKEAYLKQDADWSFVIEMGKRLKTNFGFMFDWTTGELYPKDDPRRS